MFAMMSVHSSAVETRPLTLADRPRNYLISDVAKMTFESIDQVPEKQWKQLRCRLASHAKGNGCKASKCTALAEKIVDAFQSHRRIWNPETDANLFLFLKSVVATVARMSADDQAAWFRVSDTQPDHTEVLSDRESSEFQSRRSRLEETRERRRAFKFPSLESVTDRDWELIFKETSKYADSILARHGKSRRLADAVALRVIKSVRDGSREWNPHADPNLLLFVMSVVRFTAAGIADEIEQPRRPRRHRNPIAVTSTMNVADVIANLPTVALTVDRLNGLLNPIRPPEAVDAALRDELAAVKECCLRQAQTIRELQAKAGVA